MLSLATTLFCSGLLLSSHVGAHFVKEDIRNENVIKAAPTNEFRDNLKREEVNMSPGFRVVVVYEAPKNCPIVTNKPHKTEVQNDMQKDMQTVAQTKFITRTVTTDINVTKMPESCPDRHCEPKVEKVWAAQTFTYLESMNAYGQLESEADSRIEIFGDRRFGQSPSSPGPDAIHVIKNLGKAHTTTIFTDGETTSMDYVRRPAELETKQNPLLVLKDLNGPNTLSIDFEWTISLSADFNVAQMTGLPYKTGDSDSRSTVTAVQSDGEVKTMTKGLSLASAKLLSTDMFWNKTSMSTSDASSTPKTNVSSDALQTMVLKHEESCYSNIDLFEMISDSDPSKIFQSSDHPLQILPGVSSAKPFQTNKFYSNLFLGYQNETVFTYPYEVYWENFEFHGMAIQFPDPNRRVFAGEGISGANQYYYNGIRSPGVFASATTIGEGSNFMAVSEMRELSVNIKLSATSGNTKDYIEFPLVEGMGMVTSIYHGDLVPQIRGFGGIRTFFEESYNTTSTNLNQETKRYRVKISNGETWLIFVTIPTKKSGFKLERKENFLIGSKAVDGLIIQYVLAPDQRLTTESGEKLDQTYHQLAGKYVIDAKVSGKIIDCTWAEYRISYQSKGESSSGRNLIFAFPHHFESMDYNTDSKFSGIEIPSTTKGIMRGYLTDELVFNDSIDVNVNWLPYVKNYRPDLTYTNKQIKLIRDSAVEELKNVDIVKALSGLNSQYFMGKALDKYAYIMYVLHDIVKDKKLAGEVMDALKKFFEKYKAGSIAPALYYDTKLKGVTSVAAPGDDFGSGYYNDHNFHYAYPIHAAALIGYLDTKQGGQWVKQNKDFINSLVRDVANPSDNDKFFPISRSFDWFQGHSWAKGVFASQDGKDQESSSEDVHFSYAMKMWGRVSGDRSMEARGALMLKIQEKAFNSYFLYRDDNEIVPQRILRNKVSGIFFENKVDYTVYFAKEVSQGVWKVLTEYKHGIQMIPMTPALGSVRNSIFAEQEWNQILHDIDGDEGWAGVLNANRVLFDPSGSWEFFAKPDFDYKRLDGGQSRTWALAFAAPFKNEVDGLQ